MSFASLKREWKEWCRFKALEQGSRSIVFYAEDAGSFAHFQLIIEYLTSGLDRSVCYLASSPADPILNTKNEKIRPFYIGSGTIRTCLFLNLQADVLVLTMPDLESFNIKRSKVYPVHYVYVFHSMVSTRVYRKGALDNFDTILCVGQHHIDEIRANEAACGLKAKNLVKHGYGLLDMLLRENGFHEQSSVNKNKRKCILVAPTWGENGLLETCGVELIDVLLRSGYEVIVRPHPMTRQKWPRIVEEIKNRFQDNNKFTLDINVSSKGSFCRSDCMISDWSGVSLEYAFALERPVLFVDVPDKINNPNFINIDREPLEVAIRNEIGKVVRPDNISNIPDQIEMLCKDLNSFKERIRKTLSRTVFNVGESGVAGAEHIASIADHRCIQ